jgi:hypothetical protein
MVSVKRWGCALLLAIGAGACEMNLGVPAQSGAPVAEARVVEAEGQDVSFEFAGDPVRVTLDGSRSRDPGGTIETYRWLSASTTPDEGADAAVRGDAGELPSAGASAPDTTRWTPEGAEDGWPADEMRSTVELDEGVYRFALWVIDDAGRTSEPDYVAVTVARAQPEAAAAP